MFTVVLNNVVEEHAAGERIEEVASRIVGLCACRLVGSSEHLNLRNLRNLRNLQILQK